MRTTLLIIVKKLASVGRPVVFSPREVRRIAEFLKRERVTHLGMYLMTATLKPYRLLVKALRDAGFDGVILAGGVHAALCPEESLAEGADFAVQGPGELPLRMILARAEPASVPGLVWRRDKSVVVNPQSAEQKLDLDTLPFPIYRFGQDKVLLKGRLRKYTWRIHRKYAGWQGRYYDFISSRGCPYKCAYCCRVDEGAIRRMTVDRAIRELQHLREHHPRVRGVNIQDDAFFCGSESWVEEFCRRMKAEVGLPFIVRMIPRFVTPERLEMLKSGGLHYVTMGLEGSDRLNNTLYRRPEDQKSFLKAARAILDAGLYLSIDYLINNPYETPRDLREIGLTLNSLPRPHWGVVGLSLTPFPGTPLYERCVRDKTLGRFATDAYDAMLMPTKPGGYLTPSFWVLLLTKLLPVIGEDLGKRLVTAGPENPWAAHTVQRLAKWTERLRTVTNLFRDHVPGLYGLMVRRYQHPPALPKSLDHGRMVQDR